VCRALAVSAQGAASGIDQTLHNVVLRSAVAGDAAAAASLRVDGGTWASEPAYAALRAIGEQLGARVDASVTTYDDGLVCTVGLFAFVDQSVPTSEGLQIVPRVGAPPCAVVHQYDRHPWARVVTAYLWTGSSQDFTLCHVSPEAKATLTAALAAIAAAHPEENGSYDTLRRWAPHLTPLLDCWSVRRLLANQPPLLVDAEAAATAPLTDL
jgi:hypothetical protein